MNAAMNVSFPLSFDSRGRSAEVDDDAHIRDLIEEILFTSPGERVNRPGFGCGVLQLVFAPASDALAAAAQTAVQSALQQWLGERIVVDAVDVSVVDSTLTVRVDYAIRRDGERRVAQFVRSA